uniref:C2H2-type domain-containing protein n=1 Tax=Sinocyclocheilus grahami TaxID=75366 RepID=A0A672RIG2_SINGR
MSPSQSYTEEAEPLADSEDFTAIAATEEAEEGLQQEEVLCEEKDSGVCEVQQIYLTTDGSTVVVSEFENEGEEATQLQFLEQAEIVETSGVRQVSLEQWISELTGKGISLPVLPPTPVEIVREETVYVPVIERPPSVKSIIHRKSSPPRAAVSKKVAATPSESQTMQEEKRHSCPECHKEFRFECLLRNHMRTHTGERPPFKCIQCVKTFRKKADLIKHIRVHTGERQHLCSICGKSFVYMFDLKKHQRNHERPRIKIPCTLCNKTFAGPEMLRCHLRIHTGERPFRCKICGKAFSQIGNMKRHERVHTGERPFTCERCGKTYKHSSPEIESLLKIYPQAIHDVDIVEIWNRFREICSPMDPLQ